MNPFFYGLVIGLLVGACIVFSIVLVIGRLVQRAQEEDIAGLESDLERRAAENVILRMRVNDLERHQGVPFNP